MSAPAPLPAPLGLYVHWPYCARICPYCDFNVYRARDADTAVLARAIREDMGRWRAVTGPRRLASVHFGGGTPSLAPPAELEAMLAEADRLWGFEPDAEIGLEANPKEAARFADIRAAGVERLSLGVQALDDASLAALGRDHDAAGARRALRAARALFPRVSADLIYAREGQTPAAWEAELAQALELGADHLSLYQLTIEPGTAFARKAARGALVPPPDDAAADMFALTQSVTEAAGLEAYEISNHARGAAARSRHNRLYWTGGDWVGVGPGAHSRLGAAASGGRIAAEAPARPDAYAAALAGPGEGPAAPCETLSPLEEAQERVLMGMRVSEGLDRDALAAATGRDVDASGLERALADGLAETSVRDGARIVRLTRRGRMFADAVAVALAPG